MKHLSLFFLLLSFSVETYSSPIPKNSFKEVVDVVFNQSLSPDLSNPQVLDEWETYQRNELPAYKVTWRNFWRKIEGKIFNFLKFNAKRTIAENNNFYPRLEKLVHSNGVCFGGHWSITEKNSYTGMFAQGAKGLFIGRASSANSATRKGQKRPFGFAGKIFPTMNAEESVETLNFVTIDNLSGTKAAHFLDVGLTNEPAAGFAITPKLSLDILFAFRSADKNIFFRPIDPIWLWNIPDNKKGRGPKWMMIKAATNKRIDEIDFRRELDIEKYAGLLELDIFVSNKTHKADKLDQWQRIGKISLNKSTVSYACDRQLHFHHNKIVD